MSTATKKPFNLIAKDPFGHINIIKSTLITLLGMATYSRFNIFNKLKIEGMEHILGLPNTNVLFISNHQTYYADVIALFHIFASARWRFKNINFPIYLLRPRVNVFYIAAEETMKKSGLLPKIFAYVGAITVKRSWRAGGQDVQRNADINAPAKIKIALNHGWVVTFPQGTTKAGAPVRKGAANMIKQFQPLVVPVYIDGFRRAFDKKGLVSKKSGTKLSVKFGKPISFDESATLEDIQRFIELSILDQNNTSSCEPQEHDEQPESEE